MYVIIVMLPSHKFSLMIEVSMSPKIGIGLKLQIYLNNFVKIIGLVLLARNLKLEVIPINTIHHLLELRIMKSAM